MYDFFRLKKWLSGFPVSPYSSTFSPVPWKTVDRENTVHVNFKQLQATPSWYFLISLIRNNNVDAQIYEVEITTQPFNSGPEMTCNNKSS
jgi:hypothetical protein